MGSTTFFPPRPSSAAPSGDDVGGAANAYRSAQQAELQGDHGRAAEFYELADSMAPSSEAARAAVRNLRLAGATVRAANKAAELAERYDDDRSRKLSEEILGTARRELASVEVSCEVPCAVTVAGKAVRSKAQELHRFFATPGTTEIAASFFAQGVASKTIELTAGEPTAVRFAVPEATDDPTDAPAGSADQDDTSAPTTATQNDTNDSDRPRRTWQKLSPLWFAGGAVATVGLGAATIWSGTNVLSLNRKYESDPTADQLEGGQAAEKRTNILIGVTSGVAAITVVLAVFTDWGQKRSNRSVQSKTARVQFDSFGAGVIKGRF